MENVYNQTEVAYESTPKEIRINKGVLDSKRQFGNGNKMPQENKGYKQRVHPANPNINRGVEYR